MGVWAALGPILASMAGGAASSAISNATARGGQQGYDLPMLSPSPYDAENQRLMSKLAQEAAIYAMEGKLPPGMEILLDQIQADQLRQSKEQMFGRPGDRGGSIMDATTSLGARTGVGPKATMSQGRKALDDYASRNSQIMNYINSLKFSGLQNEYNQAVPRLKSIPRSHELPYTGSAQPMGYSGSPGMDIGLGNIDWVKALERWNQPSSMGQQYTNMTGRTANSVIPMTLNNQKGTLMGYDPDLETYPAAY